MFSLFDSDGVFTAVELPGKNESISPVQHWSCHGLLNDGHQVLYVGEDAAASMMLKMLLCNAAYTVVLTIVACFMPA